MIALPLLAPAVNAMLALPLPRVATRAVGASGAVALGVTVAAVEAVPVGMPLMARSLTWYGVPLVRPVITSGDAVEAGLRVVHEPPLSVEYS